MNPQAIKLSEAEIGALNSLAKSTGSIASTSTNAGQPSWRVLVKRIARKELLVIDKAKLETAESDALATWQQLRNRYDDLMAEGNRSHDEEEMRSLMDDIRQAGAVVDGLRMARGMAASNFDFATFIDLCEPEPTFTLDELDDAAKERAIKDEKDFPWWKNDPYKSDDEVIAWFKENGEIFYVDGKRV
jgi:hypothetical protein